MDRNDLKVQALLEKISSQENQIADLRVDFTVVSNELEAATQELEKIRNTLSERVEYESKEVDEVSEEEAPAEEQE